MTLPRLLTDDPVAADGFAGKSHERIARTLVNLITGAGAQHRAIGLEGGWGSGKSTVIEIAKAMLQKESGDKTFKVFSFDSWAHHGDDFKRAFLEELLSWLEAEGMLKSNAAKNFRTELRARKRETTTTTRPQLSLTGLVLALAAPLLPVAYLWLGPLGFNEAAPGQTTFFGRNMPVNALLTLFFLVLLAPYAAFIIQLFIKKGNIAESAALFAGRQTTENSAQLIRDSDPTAVEFNMFLEKVISAARVDKINLLVVIDNIDRLPKDRMEDCWSEMRNLVALGGKESNIWRDVRVIVPYDRNHIVIGAPAEFEDGGDSRLKDAALQKIFQARIAVAPPMISHWKAFLDQKLDEAFGADALSKTIRYRLAKLYEFKLSQGQTEATPRDVISYVNQLVSIVLQWGDTVPLDCVGLFVVFRDKISKPTVDLGKGELLPDTIKFSFEDGPWQRMLAALYFNVAPEDADQVLLGNEISQLLNDGDDENLKALSVNPGFYPVLNEMIEAEAMEWASQDPHKFAVTCDTIANIDDGNPYFDSFFRQLAEAGFKLGQVKKVVPDDIARVAAIAPRAGRERGEDLLHDLAGWIDGIANEPDQQTDGAVWIGALDNIVASWKEIKGVDKDHLPARIALRHIPRDANFILEAAERSVDLEHVTFGRLKSRTNADDITKLVVDRIKKEDLEGLAAIVSRLASAKGMLNVSSITAATAARLSSGSPAIDDKGASELVSIIDLLDEKWSRGEVKNLMNDGTLAHWFSAAVNAKNWSLAAQVFWRLKEEFDDGDLPNPGAHNAYGDLANALNAYSTFKSTGDATDELLDAVCEIVESEELVSTIMAKAIEAPKKAGWARQILKRLIERGKYNRLRVETVLENFDALALLLGEELTKSFLVKFGGWDRYYDDALDGDKLYGCSVSLIEIALTPDGNSVSKLGDIVKQRLKSHDASRWEAALAKQNADIHLLLLVLRNGGLELQASAYRDPLLRHMLAVLRGEGGDAFEEDWSILLDALPAQSRKKLFSDFMKEAGQFAPITEAVRALLSVFPSTLVEAPLETYADTAVDAFLLPLFETFNADTVALVEPNLERFKTCLASSSTMTQGAFRESVQASWENAAEEDKAVIADLAKRLNIEIRDTPKTATDGADVTPAE